MGKDAVDDGVNFLRDWIEAHTEPGLKSEGGRPEDVRVLAEFEVLCEERVLLYTILLDLPADLRKRLHLTPKEIKKHLASVKRATRESLK